MRIYFLTLFLKSGRLITREISGIFVFRKESPVLVRAGYHAIAAADAFILIDRYDTIRSFCGCLGGTDLYAGSFFALIAPYRHSGHFYPIGCFLFQGY
jgi:hypothetical protein